MFFKFIAPAALFFAVTAPLHAAEISAQPYPEVRTEQRTTTEPAQQIFIARVDLTDPDVTVRVSRGGADPDGDDEFQTTLQTPSTIAARENFEVAVNGDFFIAKKTVDIEGEKSGYVTGKWAKAVGPALTDGLLWAPPVEIRPVFMIDDNHRARIAKFQNLPANARQVIAGSDILLQDGQTVVAPESGFSKTRHPRTAVGLTDDGKTMILVVVDGRSKERAIGMSLAELTVLMRDLGCRDALNLDGGGSSELLVRDPQSGQLQVRNRPSDGRERAVANVLGVTIRGSRRVPGVAFVK